MRYAKMKESIRKLKNSINDLIILIAFHLGFGEE
jgi:hypothetical protein